MTGDDAHVVWGVGLHESIVTASLKAVISAINRDARIRAADTREQDAPRP